MSSRAILPERGYRRQSPLDASALEVTIVDGAGRTHGPFGFADLPTHGQVRKELVGAFVAATSADGPWQSPSSVRTAHSTVRHFLRQLEGLEVRIGTLADFTPEHWWAWRADVESRNRWPGQISIMRTLLRHCPEVGPLTLKAMTHRTSKPKRRLYGAYTPTEFAAVRAAALDDLRTAEARVRRNAARLHAHWAGDPVDVPGTVFMNGRHWTAGEVLDRLYRLGRLFPKHGYRKPVASVSELLGHPEVAPTNAMFPTKLEIFSAMVLLVCDRGYNLSTLASLQVPESAGEDSDGGAVLITHLDKPRRRSLRHFTHSHAGPGARAIELVVSLTEPARTALELLGHPTDQLFIAATPRGTSRHPTGTFVTEDFTNGGTAREWSTRLNLRGEDGAPFLVSLARLRLTEQVVNRKASQNTDAVSEDIYRSPEALTAAMVSDVILDGQHDAIDHANQTVRMRFVADPTELAVSDETRQALTEGRIDTATGACLDHLHSPHTPTGSACTASFLTCLACPNAVATPAHLPRLVTLERALGNLATVAPARFTRLYKTHRDRLTDVLHQAGTPTELQQASAHATDEDRDMIERLLKRELDG